MTELSDIIERYNRSVNPTSHVAVSLIMPGETCFGVDNADVAASILTSTLKMKTDEENTAVSLYSSGSNLPGEMAAEGAVFLLILIKSKHNLNTTVKEHAVVSLSGIPEFVDLIPLEHTVSGEELVFENNSNTRVKLHFAFWTPIIAMEIFQSFRIQTDYSTPPPLPQRAENTGVSLPDSSESPRSSLLVGMDSDSTDAEVLPNMAASESELSTTVKENTDVNAFNISEFPDSRSLQQTVSDADNPEVTPNIHTSKTNLNTFVVSEMHGKCLPRSRNQFLINVIKWWIWMLILAAVLPTSTGSYTVRCYQVQYAPLKGRAVLKCDGLLDFPSIYWLGSTDDGAPAFIQKVNGKVTGKGNTTDGYDIDDEGSLVIYNVTFQDEKTFRVIAVDTELRENSYNITLVVYVESAQPLPLIPECSGQSTCILKVDSHKGISCIHGESRPAMEVSWFLRVGREDRLLNATVNYTVSADAVTVTTSAQLAMEEIPFDANMNQLLVLVCKSNQSVPGVKGTERKILLDNSVDDPFTNEESLDRTYAFERQEDFKIKCQSEIDTTNNVVLWMHKSLISEIFENILYSAYGEVSFTTKGEAGFNITDDGALVIKEVDRQHEGYYACVSSLENTMESSVQNLTVIVLPKPPRIVVQGCEPFQPCHLSAQEAETITCTVNGVRPQVDLSIVTSSMDVAAVSSHIEDGLFYTTVTGQVDVSKATCGKNVTVICQARGPAAYGFMSDAYFTILVDGNGCINSSTDAVLPNDDGSNNHWLKLSGIVFISVLLTVATLVLAVLYGKKILFKIQHIFESKPHQIGSERGNTELGRLTEATIV